MNVRRGGARSKIVALVLAPGPADLAPDSSIANAALPRLGSSLGFAGGRAGGQLEGEGLVTVVREGTRPQ
jgi:hypothetical protein